MNKLVIIGAGGHGKGIADNAMKNGYTDICFIDDNSTGKCMDLPIVGTSADIENMNDGNTDFIIGIGSNAVRKKIAEKYNVNWVTLIHPSGASIRPIWIPVNVSYNFLSTGPISSIPLGKQISLP